MTSWIEIARMISAIGSLVAACASVIGAVVTLKNSRKIQEVHLLTNGMRADLIRATGDLRYAEGLKEGARQNGTPS